MCFFVAKFGTYRWFGAGIVYVWHYALIVVHARNERMNEWCRHNEVTENVKSKTFLRHTVLSECLVKCLDIFLCIQFGVGVFVGYECLCTFIDIGSVWCLSEDVALNA